MEHTDFALNLDVPNDQRAERLTQTHPPLGGAHHPQLVAEPHGAQWSPSQPFPSCDPQTSLCTAALALGHFLINCIFNRKSIRQVIVEQWKMENWRSAAEILSVPTCAIQKAYWLGFYLLYCRQSEINQIKISECLW